MSKIQNNKLTRFAFYRCRINERKTKETDFDRAIDKLINKKAYE